MEYHELLQLEGMDMVRETWRHQVDSEERYLLSRLPESAHEDVRDAMRTLRESGLWRFETSHDYGKYEGAKDPVKAVTS